ncbi:MAG: polysaccharide pyruvyl transferase family protein, partial [Gammaproteobacteria bacterium]
MTDNYVLLTGGKSNAGDFLIKKRAIALLGALRPDRQLIDVNAWEPVDDTRLEIINRSKALILTGGPALQKNMYPGVYPLRENLDEIEVPILALGIGWKSLTGNWSDTRNYPLSRDTLRLLQRIDRSGYLSSVRDYHTLNVLFHHGFNNFQMTGCPALYSPESEWSPNLNSPIKKVSFSLGVSFLSSKVMEQQMQSMLSMLGDKFGNSRVTTVFHHSTSQTFLKTHNATRHHLKGHLKFIEWLEARSFPYVDISGSADRMIEHYSGTDMHVGYRVHAHILMSSISKPSILLAEDGRGKALK